MNVYVALIFVTLVWVSLFSCSIYLAAFIKALYDNYCFNVSSILIFIVCGIVVIADMLFLCCH